MAHNTSTVRISNHTREALDDIAAREGRSRSSVLADAVERYQRERFFKSIDDGYARLRQDKKTWDEELCEREDWDGTIADGLEGE
jgi:predicted transcriptional regulator